jgi:hypothetical protein
MKAVFRDKHSSFNTGQKVLQHWITGLSGDFRHKVNFYQQPVFWEELC